MGLVAARCVQESPFARPGRARRRSAVPLHRRPQRGSPARRRLPRPVRSCARSSTNPHISVGRQSQCQSSSISTGSARPGHSGTATIASECGSLPLDSTDRERGTFLETRTSGAFQPCLRHSTTKNNNKKRCRVLPGPSTEVLGYYHSVPPGRTATATTVSLPCSPSSYGWKTVPPGRTVTATALFCTSARLTLAIPYDGQLVEMAVEDEPSAVVCLMPCGEMVGCLAWSACGRFVRQRQLDGDWITGVRCTPGARYRGMG